MVRGVRMRFRTSLSCRADLESACREAIASVRDESLGDPDLAVVFVSPSTLGEPRRVPELIAERLGARHLIGCSGGGILGAGQEVEEGPALGLTAAWLPGVDLHVRHVEEGDLPSPDAPPAAWVDLAGIQPTAARGFLLLPEPFTFAAEQLVAGLDFAYPRAPKVGGLVSGSQRPDLQVLFANETHHTSGAVLLGLSGNVVMETVVAQGCRPFGRAAAVTAADQHQLLAIDGRPALHFLQEQIHGLTPHDLDRVRGNPVFLGVARDPLADDSPGEGDFLIRNLIGVDEKSGGLTVGDYLGVGRIVQFHVRDRWTSDQDLRSLLERRQQRHPESPVGALMFTCLGRGRGLYGDENHDTRIVQEILGDVPLAGFFCNGEIGPVHGQTCLHGFTSALALFTPVGA